MNKIILLFLFISSVVLAEDKVMMKDSFITKYEYGKMLYNNPRGIGCKVCHGEYANGKKIVSFEHIYREKKYNCELKIPGIRNIKYEVFLKKINSKKRFKKRFNKKQVCEKLIYNANLMPTYFLVEDEIEAIYYYVEQLKVRIPFPY